MTGGNVLNAKTSELRSSSIGDVMTLSASEYRKLAQDCLDMAERATPEMKIKLHEMAELWLKLVTQHLTSRLNLTSRNVR